jgi:hypothetical protein
MLVSFISTLFLVILPIVAGKIAFPTFMTEFGALLKDKASATILWEKFLTLYSQHPLLLTVLIAAYWIMFSSLKGGVIQISLDIIDTDSSSLKRLFSWFSKAHKIAALAIVYCTLLLWHDISELVLRRLFLPFDSFKNFSQFAQHVGSMLLAAFMFFAFIPFVICMIYVTIRLILTPFAFVDHHGRSIVQAFKQSWKITFKNVLKIIIFGIVNGFMLAFAALVWLLLVGIVAIALAMLLYAIIPPSKALESLTLSVTIFLIVMGMITYGVAGIILPFAYIYRRLSPRKID